MKPVLGRSLISDSVLITCCPAILQATQCGTPECLALEVILGHGVDTVALCLVARCYGHAGDLFRLIGEQVGSFKFYHYFEY